MERAIIEYGSPNGVNAVGLQIAAASASLALERSDARLGLSCSIRAFSKPGSPSNGRPLLVSGDLHFTSRSASQKVLWSIRQKNQFVDTLATMSWCQIEPQRVPRFTVALTVSLIPFHNRGMSFWASTSVPNPGPLLRSAGKAGPSAVSPPHWNDKSSLGRNFAPRFGLFALIGAPSRIDTVTKEIEKKANDARAHFGRLFNKLRPLYAQQDFALLTVGEVARISAANTNATAEAASSALKTFI